jgi:hypothetical protein
MAAGRQHGDDDVGSAYGRRLVVGDEAAAVGQLRTLAGPGQSP